MFTSPKKEIDLNPSSVKWKALYKENFKILVSMGRIKKGQGDPGILSIMGIEYYPKP